MYKETLVNLLVSSGALRFGEFTLNSGRVSPYFMNAGMFCSGSHIEILGKIYAEHIKNTLADGEYDILFGPAYKGIPLAISAACALYRDFGVGKQYSFNRKEAKDHGEGGLFVGAEIKDGSRLILIEDVVTSGTAVRAVYPILTAHAKIELKHMFILVDRMEKGVNGNTAPKEIEAEFGIKVHPVINTKDIIDLLHNREIDGSIILTDEIKGKMERYMNIYCGT